MLNFCLKRRAALEDAWTKVLKKLLLFLPLIYGRLRRFGNVMCSLGGINFFHKTLSQVFATSVRRPDKTESCPAPYVIVGGC